MALFPQGAIASLLAAANQFAALHPAIAGLLGSGTPMTGRLERVRRGVFALATSVLEKISELDEDSYAALAAVVDSSLMRPFPAATIAQLSTTDDLVRRVPAGAEVMSGLGGTHRFRLVSDIDVGPFAIANARIHGMSLQFDLVGSGFDDLEETVGEDVRIYVDGPREHAFALVTHLLTNVSHADMSTDGGHVRRLGDVAAYGTRPEDMLAPELDGPPNMSGLLREFFLFPEKFLFFVVKGVRSALRGTNARNATITIRFSVPLPAGVSIASDSLKAHCVPVVNLFPATSEPQTFGPGTSNFRVHVAGLPRSRSSVYDIISATAIPRNGHGPAVPLPAARRFAAGEMSSDFPYAYTTRRTMGWGANEEPALFVALTSPRGTQPLLEPHVISLQILATNGACDLAPGDISEPGVGMPPSIRVRSILPTSPYVPACAGADLAFRAFMRGAIPHRDPLFALKTVLFSLLPPDTVDPALFRANVAQVHAIEQLHVGPVVHEDGSRRGYRATFAIDETPFLGTGHVAQLVRLLHDVLDGHVPINGFYDCEATCRKSGELIRWPGPDRRQGTPHKHPCNVLPSVEARTAQHTRPRTVATGKNLTPEDLVPLIAQYGFFDATRILEHILDVDAGRESGGIPSRIRFTQLPSLTYPSHDVAGLEVIRNDGHRELRLGLRFLGLVGTASPLSAQWTREVMERDDGGLLGALYDVLHHPLALCLYQAWQSRAIEGGFDLAGRDPLSQILRSLAGVDASTVIPDDALPGMVALGLADHQRGQPHTIDIRSAEQLLQRLLPWPISIEPNVCRVTGRSPSETAQLGGTCAMLGEDFVYGEERDDTDGLIRLHVGPVDRRTYESLMPGGDAYARLERLTTRVLNGKIGVELEVHVDADDLPTWKLGASTLGVDTYYSTELELEGPLHVRIPLLRDPAGVVREFVKPTTD